MRKHPDYNCFCAAEAEEAKLGESDYFEIDGTIVSDTSNKRASAGDER